MTSERRGAYTVLSVAKFVDLNLWLCVVSEVGIAKIKIHIKQKPLLFFMQTSRWSEFKQPVLSEMHVWDPDENIWWIFVLNDSDSDDSDSDLDDADSEGTSGGEH